VRAACWALHLNLWLGWRVGKEISAHEASAGKATIAHAETVAQLIHVLSVFVPHFN